MKVERKPRIAWIDIAKCITIFLVVLGHTLRGGIVQKIVYSFHVTTFFFLSGMTCKTDNMAGRMKKDFLRIMIPYYSFGVLSIFAFAVLGKFAAGQLGLSVNTSFGSNFAELLYMCPQGGRMKFNVALWFLPCLFITKVLYYVLCKFCREKQIYVVFVSFLLAVIGFVYTYLDGPGLPFHLAVSFKMIMFFSLGRCFFVWYQSNETRFCKDNKILILGAVLLALTALIASATPKINYSSDLFPSVLAFLVTSLSGSLGVCFVSMGIRSRKMEHIGKSTLAILVMHKFPVLLFQTIGPQKTLLYQYDSVVCILVATLVSAVSIGLCLAAQWLISRFFPFLLGDFSKALFQRRCGL